MQKCVYCGKKTRIILEVGISSKAICFDCLKEIEDFFAHKNAFAEPENVTGVSFLSDGIAKEYVEINARAISWIHDFCDKNNLDSWQLDEFAKCYSIEKDGIGEKKLLQDTAGIAKQSGKTVKELIEGFLASKK